LTKKTKKDFIVLIDMKHLIIFLKARRNVFYNAS